MPIDFVFTPGVLGYSNDPPSVDIILSEPRPRPLQERAWDIPARSSCLRTPQGFPNEFRGGIFQVPGPVVFYLRRLVCTSGRGDGDEGDGGRPGLNPITLQFKKNRAWNIPPRNS